MRPDGAGGLARLPAGLPASCRYGATKADPLRHYRRGTSSRAHRGAIRTQVPERPRRLTVGIRRQMVSRCVTESPCLSHYPSG